MHIITNIENINRQQWEQLVAESSVATWFQTPEAYDFFASLPTLMSPFVVAYSNDSCLKGVIVGYITKEKSAFRQCFTRRAIIMGGPLLANDITDTELQALLNALRTFEPSNLQTLKPIYLESRNFNDYSRWRNTFEACGFSYQPHLNFHIDTSSIDSIDANMSKARKRDIHMSQTNGAVLIEHPTIEQVRKYYDLLVQLYRKKIHTPLFPWAFFETLYDVDSSVFLLIEQDGAIIGGGTYVELSHRTLYAWWGCSTNSLPQGIHPLTLANYEAMRYAATHDCPRFDMMGAGKPTEGYGVRDFKRQFGGTLVEHGRFLHIHSPLLYNLGTLGIRLMKRLRI